MQGYIHSSRKSDSVGFITCCSGSCLADFWQFSFDDCDSDLEDKLREKDVTGIPKGACSPTIPPSAIRVSFTSKISGNEMVADNVIEI